MNPHLAPPSVRFGRPAESKSSIPFGLQVEQHRCSGLTCEANCRKLYWRTFVILLDRLGLNAYAKSQRFVNVTDAKGRLGNNA
jgi:hypothetical protein